MRWDRLSRLIDQISDDLDKQGYYSIAKFWFNDINDNKNK